MIENENQFKMGLELFTGNVPIDDKVIEAYAHKHNRSGINALLVLYEEQHRKGYRLLREAAEQGHADAQYFVGRALLYGTGVTSDTREASRWFIRAANNGSALAQIQIGKWYLPSDVETARSWFKRAASQGSSEAMYQLGEIAAYADDRDEAIHWYRAAAQEGHTEAAYDLGCALSSEDPAESTEWFKKAAEQDHSEAMAFLGSAYLHGKGIEQDIDQAIVWLEKSVKADNKLGQFLLGSVYVDHGIEANLEKGIDLLRKSATAESSRSPGNKHAQKKLANTFMMAGMRAMVEHDDKNIEPLHREASEWFKLAVEQGDTGSMGKLAILYENGMGVEKDEDEAIRLYRRAAAEGDDFATRQLRQRIPIFKLSIACPS